MKELEYKGYRASVEYSGDDKVHYGKISGINDLVSFEADSEQELKAAFIKAVDDYLKTCVKVGKSPDMHGNA